MATHSSIDAGIDDFRLAETARMDAPGIAIRTALAAIRMAQEAVDRILELSARVERRSRE
jgi:hypothetical protein